MLWMNGEMLWVGDGHSAHRPPRQREIMQPLHTGFQRVHLKSHKIIKPDQRPNPETNWMIALGDAHAGAPIVQRLKSRGVGSTVTLSGLCGSEITAQMVGRVPDPARLTLYQG